MSSTDRSQMMKEFFAEELKAAEEKGKRKLRRAQLIEMSEICLMYEHEEMGTRLARVADDGCWDNDVGNADSQSVYDSEARYCDVVAQVAMFLNEKGLTGYGAKFARLAKRPDLIKHRSAIRGEKDKEESAQDREESDGVSRDEEGKGNDVVDVVSTEITGLTLNEKDVRAEDDQEEKSAMGQPPHPQTQALRPLPPGHSLDQWPVGGIADKDPAADYIIGLMRGLNNLKRRPLTSAHVNVIRSTAEDKILRPYQQASARVHSISQVSYGGLNAAGYNFLFPVPGREGLMGKVDCSRLGLALIIQVMRAVVCNYETATPIPPLGPQVNRLNEPDGWMQWRLPLQQGQTYYVLAEPFEIEGVRSALAALQTAARHSTSGYVLFYVYPVDVDTREGKLAATLDLHPIIGWRD
ncbi:hypothetical protein F5883DRAFT_708829 [Diaporthe sp. PMI_573]|nr:hypothetical protein F5883DRAFT_708829 [Diaporthaceae sp. PMI_573]